MKPKKNQPIRPAKCLSDIKNLLAAYHDFLDAFETVFHRDADTTYDNFKQGEVLDLEAAIANPDQFDGDNRANFDNLLRHYGSLKHILGEGDI